MPMRGRPGQRAKKTPTAKQRAFIRAYLNNGRNGLRAYETAYGPHSAPARSIGERVRYLLAHPALKPWLDEADKQAQLEVDECVRAYALSQGRLALELCHIAFANILDYLAIDGSGLARIDLSEMTRDQAAAIKEFTCDVIGTQMVEGPDGERQPGPPILRVKIKLVDKIAAVERLGRLMGYILPDAPPPPPTPEKLPNIIFQFVGNPNADEQPRVVNPAPQIDPS